MARTEEQEKLFQQSGSFATNSHLVAFLYELMRDHLPTGVVESLVNHNSTPLMSYTLTNGWLAKYAEHLAGRLK